MADGDDPTTAVPSPTKSDSVSGKRRKKSTHKNGANINFEALELKEAFG